MKITDIFSAKSLALQYTEAAENKIPYLGATLFPAKKKMGLDLSWIKAHKGLPVSLAPSNFDAKSVLRSREGFTVDKTQMAFFRESMLVKEQDEQDIMRVQEANDPYAMEVLSHIYDDANTLIDGAMVVPERMIMQLLAPQNAGSPGIVIEANGVQYSYNYDVSGTYATDNYEALTSTAKWDVTASSDPLKDLTDGQDAVEALNGSRPTRVIMAQETWNYLKKSANVKSAVLAQNVSANVLITDNLVKELIRSQLGLEVAVYNKKVKDEEGNVTQLYPNGFVTLLPDGYLGNTYYGTTPEERMLNGKIADVSIVNTGVAVCVSQTVNPVNTMTTVSEIVLPSYERMDETYVIKAY